MSILALVRLKHTTGVIISSTHPLLRLDLVVPSSLGLGLVANRATCPALPLDPFAFGHGISSGFSSCVLQVRYHSAVPRYHAKT